MRFRSKTCGKKKMKITKCEPTHGTNARKKEIKAMKKSQGQHNPQ